MKISLKTVFCSVVFLCTASYGQNLLNNSSFEQIDKKNLPVSWNRINGYLDQAPQFVEKNAVLDGKNAVRTNNTDKTTAKKITHWIQSGLKGLDSIADGTPMELSVYVYPIEKAASVHLFFESPSERTSAAKHFWSIAPNRWKKLTIPFKWKKGVYKSAHVCLQLYGNGQMVFDCAYLGPAGKNPYNFDGAALEKANAAAREKLPKAGNLIKNSSFEMQQERKEIPEYWETINNVPSKTRQYQEKAIVLDGAVAVRTDNTDKTASRGIIHWIQKDFKHALDAIPEGTQMELSVYAYPVDKPAMIHLFFESPSAKSSGEKYFRNIKPGKWQQLTVRFPLKKGDFKTSHVCLQLYGNGQVVFDCAYFGPAGNNPYTNIKIEKTPAEIAANDYCRMLEANTGSRYLPGKAPKTATLEMILPEKKLAVTLSEIDGKVIKNWIFDNIPVRQKHTLKIELPELAESAYELNYKSGKYEDFDCFRVGNLPKRGAYLDETGFPVVDGEKLFPVIITVPSSDPDALRVYKASGMNMIFCQSPLLPEFYEYMSELMEKFGMYWFHWDSWGFSDWSENTLREKFTSTNNMVKKRGRFMGFYSDEAMWNGISLASMRRSYKYMMRYLPDYISYLNHAPRLTGAAGEDRHSRESGRRYTRACDLSSVDIYPFPEGHGHNNLANRTMSCVGEYTDICREFTWNTRPVWMIIQAGGWSEEGDGRLNARLPRPGKKEMRFMAWNAITHGAKGIGWYGKGCKDVYSVWWLELAEVSWELAEMGKLIMASPIKYLKDLPAGISGISGKGYTVYVNETKDTITVAGKPLGGQEVRIITDKPLNIPKLNRFSRQAVKLSRDYGFDEVIRLDADWVCHPNYSSGVKRNVFAKQSFNLDSLPKDAKLNMSVDDEATVYINGKEVGFSDSYRLIQQFDITSYLKKGDNIIEFDIVNYAGPTALVFEIRADGKKVIASGGKTLFSLDSRDNFVPSKFVARHTKGTWGNPVMVQRMNGASK